MVQNKKTVKKNKFIQTPPIEQEQKEEKIFLPVTDELVQEILDGKWGVDDERKEKLTAAGYNYQEAQSKVNEYVGGARKTIVSGEKTMIEIDSARFFNKQIAKTYTTIGRVNLRAGANFSKPVLTIVENNENVICYGYYTDNWYYVKYNNYTGFMCKDYLK